LALTPDSVNVLQSVQTTEEQEHVSHIIQSPLGFSTAEIIVYA